MRPFDQPAPYREPRLTRLRDLLPSWRREALRTTLWLVPTVLVAVAGVMFAFTFALDRLVYSGRIGLPWWINAGSADSGRQVLGTTAAAVITVVGVVFSIVILALQLASTQFGPRMLRNFVRDVGTQMTLGTFVGTFVYAVLALGSISSAGPRPDFVPHISISVAVVLLLLDLGVLIYFIHHVAVTIQLNEVVAGIGRDLQSAIDQQYQDAASPGEMDPGDEDDPDPWRLLHGEDVLARRSGYLQAVSYGDLVRLAAASGALIELVHRPGHFVVAGRPLARVWPATAASPVTQALERAHITGHHRTLTQDPVFAVDQLVEIAIRALSPAVNDTFTALSCVDWLTAGLCHLSGRTVAIRVLRDSRGVPRVIQRGVSYDRVVDGAFDKVRQASRGMPALAIRQLSSLGRIVESAASEAQRAALLRQADMIMRASDESIAEPEDLEDIRVRYEEVRTLAGLEPPAPAHPVSARRGTRPR